MSNKSYYYDPKTGITHEVVPTYGKGVDYATGKEVDNLDLQRQEALKRGLTPLQRMYVPTTGKEKWIKENALQSARDMGYMYDYEYERFNQDEPTTLQRKKVPEQYVRALATKYDVPFEKVDEMLEFAGLTPDYREDRVAENLKHTTGETLGLGAPQFLYKKFALDDKEEQVFDALREKGLEFESKAEKIGEITGEVAAGAVGPVYAKFYKNIVYGAGVGAAEGTFRSKQGEELEAAAIGGLVGGAATGAFELLSRAGKKAPEVIREQNEQLSKELKETEGWSIDEAIDNYRSTHKQEVKSLERSFTGEVPAQDDVAAIAEAYKNEKNFKRLAEEIGPERAAEIKIEQHTLDFAREFGFTRTSNAKVVEQYVQITKQLDESKAALKKTKGLKKPSVKEMQKLQAQIKDTQRQARKLERKVYARDEVMQEARDFLKMEKQKLGDAAFAMRVRGKVDSRVVNKLFADRLSMTIPEEGGIFTKIADMLTDGKMMARMIDRRLGTTVEATVMDLDKKIGMSHRFLTSDKNNIVALKTKLDAVADDVFNDETAGAFIESAEAFSRLKPEQQKVVEEMRNLFEGMRQEKNKIFDFEIPEYSGTAGREHYFPGVALPLERRISVMRAQFSKALAEAELPGNLKASDISEAQYAKVATTESGKELILALQSLGQTTITKKNDFVKRFLEQSNLSDDLLMKADTTAASLLKRQGDLPQFVRETSFSRAALNWAKQMNYHGMASSDIEKLKYFADIAKTVKDKRAEEWLTKLAQDLTGVRPGSVAGKISRSTTKFKADLQTLIDQTEDGIKKTSLQVMQDSVNLFPTLTMMPYPNFLGLSVRSIIMNLTQPLTMTFPRVPRGIASAAGIKSYMKMAKLLAGGKEKFKVTNPSLKAELDSAAQRGKKYAFTKYDPKTGVLETSNLQLILAENNLASGQLDEEMVAILRSGMESNTKAFKVIRDSSEAYSRFAMGIYGYTESINRYVVMDIADGIFNAVKRGKPDGKAYLDTMPPAMQRKFQEALTKGDADAKQFLREHLVSETVFNYTRSSLSEFGRSMGPLFSMFTKWPTAIFGDIRDRVDAKGMMGAAEAAKIYLAPLAGLWMAGMLGSAMIEDEDVKNEIFTKRGLTGWAPITSIEAFSGGEFLQTPAIELGVNLTSGILSGDPIKIGKSLDEGISALTPGMALFRLYFEDIPRLTGAELPGVERERGEIPTFKPKVFQSLGRELSKEMESLTD